MCSHFSCRTISTNIGLILRHLLILIPACLYNISYAQTPTEAYEFITNPFVQPNDSTLNWYGSGDANNDKYIDQNDILRLDQVAAGSYTDPNDRRLRDRCDVNGDALVNSSDKTILQSYVSGTITYLPGQWNKLQTRAEKENWLQKMLAIDRSDTTCFTSGQHIQGCDCSQYSAQMLINFNGYIKSDLNEFLRIYPYDTINNGRFNMPVLKFSLFPYIEGYMAMGHGMNTILLGNNAKNWYDYSNIEPQFDAMNVQIGDYYVNVGELSNGIYIDSLLIFIEGRPIYHYAYYYPEVPLSTAFRFIVVSIEIPGL